MERKWVSEGVASAPALSPGHGTHGACLESEPGPKGSPASGAGATGQRERWALCPSALLPGPVPGPCEARTWVRGERGRGHARPAGTSASAAASRTQAPSLLPSRPRGPHPLHTTTTAAAAPAQGTPKVRTALQYPLLKSRCSAPRSVASAPARTPVRNASGFHVTPERGGWEAGGID